MFLVTAIASIVTTVKIIIIIVTAIIDINLVNIVTININIIIVVSTVMTDRARGVFDLEVHRLEVCQAAIG